MEIDDVVAGVEARKRWSCLLACLIACRASCDETRLRSTMLEQSARAERRG